jgi:ABC-type nitrate/sulfonate/bicarbonate transport system substrate-binding protein
MIAKLILCALAACAVAAPSSVRAADLVRIAIVNTTDTSVEPVYAEAKGFFQRAGIEPQITSFTNGAAVLAAIVGGSIDVGFANPLTVALAYQKGIPIVLLAPAMVYTARATPVWVVEAKHAPALKGAALNGKVVAVSSLGGELQLHVAAWMDRAGGNSSSAHFIELSGSAMVAALTAGRIDAATIGEPLLTLHHDDVQIVGDAYSGISPVGLGGVFVASKQWAQEHEQAARQVRDVLLQTARWANTHQPESGAILAQYAKLDPATAKMMRRVQYGEVLSPQLIQPLFDVALKYGYLKQPVNAATFLADLAPFPPAPARP